MPLDDDALLRRLHSTEHTFTERKAVGDSRDWVKTVVAFANTLDPSQEAVLFIGAKDSGEIEPTRSNLDSLQKKLSEKMQDVFPSIYYTTAIVKEEDRECLAIIVPGSPKKPHFAGSLYLRDGSQSVVANAQQYEAILTIRTSKSRELQRWIGRDITILEFKRVPGITYQVSQSAATARVIGCNQFYLTLFLNNRRWSYTLGSFEIGYDHINDRLQIERTAIATEPY